MLYINKQPRAKVIADNILKYYPNINKNAVSIYKAVRMSGGWKNYSFAPVRLWEMLVDNYYSDVICMEEHEEESLQNILAEIDSNSDNANIIHQRLNNILDNIQLPDGNSVFLKKYITQMAANTVSVKKLITLAVWRYTQGIYSFDDTIANELIKSEISDDIPFEVFQRLPEWSIYIDTSNVLIDWNNEKLNDFWITLTTDELESKNEIYMVMDTENAPRTWSFELKGESLNESLKLAFADYSPIIQDNNKLTINTNELSKMKKLLSLVLYICSDEPESMYLEREFKLTDIERPKEKHTKHSGLTIFPADKCKNYILGLKTGAAIRKAVETDTKRDIKSSGKKTHIRRGHWHGFWTGSKNTTQTFKYKWLFPMLIEGNKKEK